MSVLAAIAVLAILIVVHELGHFTAARVQGIHVNRFSIGFGPALLKYQGKLTEYALRIFPLGGYVGFPDDDPDSNIPPDDPNLLRNRPIFDRAIVISAGVVANLIFAYFLLVAEPITVGVPDSFNFQPGVEISQILTDKSSPAVQAGLKADDIVLSVNNQSLGASKESTATLKEIIEKSPNKPLELTVQRGQESLSLTVTPRADAEGKGKIGVGLAPRGEIVRHRVSIWEALSMGTQEFERITTLTAQGFGQLISHFGETASQVGGPVKIVEEGAKMANKDGGFLFQFGAIISINLAIINILPLPALDGGQLVFLLIEALLGKPLPLKVQEGIMQTGLFLLLGLGMFLIVRDTANLQFFQELFQ
jgi:membrane-associated protease RseP (regulator of RpoE activity)